MNMKRVLAALLCAGIAPWTSASITGSTGAIEVIAAPADAQLEALTSSTRIRAWNEGQDVTLGSALNFEAWAPGTYDEMTDLGTYSLSAGTHLSSHYIHFDTPGSGPGMGTGTVTFSSPIIAVICRGDHGTDLLGNLDASDFLGSPTLYPDMITSRGLELDPNADRFMISADGLTLAVDLGVGFPGDFMRVITTVPAPGAAPVLALALAALSRRRR